MRPRRERLSRSNRLIAAAAILAAAALASAFSGGCGGGPAGLGGPASLGGVAAEAPQSGAAAPRPDAPGANASYPGASAAATPGDAASFAGTSRDAAATSATGPLAALGPAHARSFVGKADLEAAYRRAPEVCAAIADLAGKRGETAGAGGSPGGPASPAGFAAGQAGPAPFAAAVVPHHAIAGFLPAGLLAYLAPDPPDILVIVGPDHFLAGPAVGTGAASWVTPDGVVEADSELVGALIAGGLAEEAWEAHDGEHSLGALMPYVARYLPRTKVVPITLGGDVTRERAAALGRSLREWAGGLVAPAQTGASGGQGATSAGATSAFPPTAARGRQPRVFLLASVDFSHYLTLEEADASDAVTLDVLRRGDFGTLFTLGSGHLDSPASLALAFAFAGTLDSPRFAVVAHTNSATLLGRPDLDETTSHFLMLLQEGSS